MWRKSASYLIFFGFLLLVGNGQKTARRFNLEITDMSCPNISSLVVVNTCSWTCLGPSAYAVDILLSFAKPITKDLEIRLSFDMSRAGNTNVLRMLDVKLDGCQSVQSFLSNPIMRMLITEFRRTSNFPVHCPLQADKLYKVENYSFSAADFPPYLPDSNFTFTLEMQHQRLTFARYSVYGSISSNRYVSLPRTTVATLVD